MESKAATDISGSDLSIHCWPWGYFAPFPWAQQCLEQGETGDRYMQGADIENLEPHLGAVKFCAPACLPCFILIPALGDARPL